jgi:putative nucleotidyltransferase with HDIG domain
MKDKLDSYIEKVENLPAAPAVLVKLISLFQQPDRDVDQIVELMSRDPSLTAEVLRHANSAYFGNEERIVDVFEAVMRLGFHRVYQTAVAKFGMQALSMPHSSSGIDVAAIWHHAAASAATAGAIAKRVEEAEGVAFTAGLLHDIGKVVMASAEGARYTALANEFVGAGALLEEKETEMFGFAHSEVGARLLEQWGLPEEISVPVRFHHRVDGFPPYERLCAVVSLGDCMAHVAKDKTPGTRYDSKEAVSAMSVLQLGKDDLAQLLQDAQADLERLTKLLSPGAK